MATAATAKTAAAAITATAAITAITDITAPLLEMPPETITLRSVKSFYVGGTDLTLSGLPVQKRQIIPAAQAREVDMNGSYVVGQLYVQEYRLANPRYPYPILLWHGGGMCGSQWEATPDGRDGWLWHFLQMGFDVLVSDGPERGRSPWLIPPQGAVWAPAHTQADASASMPPTEMPSTGTPRAKMPPAKMPVVTLTDLPVYRSRQEAWSLFRIGAPEQYADDPRARVPYAGQQFPVGAFDAFASQFVPRWLGRADMEQHAYEALVRKVGPCIVIGHSQGGGYALRVAQACPAQVRAVVALEPTGMPETADYAYAPHLAIWGDHLAQSPVWTGYRNDAQVFWARLARHAPASQIDLPEQGIRGNSHFMMLDRNSRDIARLVGEWLQRSIQD